MTRHQGLRERKKAQQRQHIADIAAALFAERGYDAVSVGDVARAAEVSDQTVYNYYPAKHELVLDRADEILELYGRVVLERPAATSPASALRPLVTADIDRFRGGDRSSALGEFPALCLQSGVLRRFALELRERQVERVADAITSTTTGIPPIIARLHAASLVAVTQLITDEIGAHVVSGTRPAAAAAPMVRAANEAFDHLDRTFRTLDLVAQDTSS